MRLTKLGKNPFIVDSLVLVESSVWATIERFRQDQPNKAEAGGILLGFRRGRHLHVVEATPPASGDRRRRFGFDRSPKRHLAIALDRWHRTGGKMDYVGEWHTHPEANPSPSTIDLAAWHLICATRKPPMIFIIAGNADIDWYGLGMTGAVRAMVMAQVGNNDQTVAA